MTAQLVNTRGAVARLGVSESFLNKLRIVGRGPPFAKLAGAVRYDIAELDLWVRSRTRRSTSEPDRRWGWPRTAARPRRG